MFCEKCGNLMNDGDVFCTKCGYRITPAQVEEIAQEEQTVQETQAAGEAQGNPNVQVTDAAQGDANVQAADTVQGDANVQAADTAQGDMSVQATDAAQSNPYIQPAYATTIDYGASDMTPQKKKSTLPIILGVVAAVVVVLAGTAVVNAKALGNLIHKTFSSPEDYYHWVENQAVKDATAAMGNFYGSYILSLTELNDKSAGCDVTFELGEEGSDLLGLLGVEDLYLSWIESGGISIDVSNKDGYITADASALLNRNPIISGSMIFDVEEQMIYARVPELSKTWLGFGEEITGFGQDEADEYFAAMEEFKENAKAFPTQKEVEALVEKYYATMIGSLDHVKMKNTTMEVAGIEQRCTALVVTVDQDAVVKMAEKLYSTAAKDKDLKKVVGKLATLADEDADPDEIYEEFLDGLGEGIDELEDGLDEDFEYVMTVYVDGKGNICGRKVEMEDARGNTVESSSLMPQKGSKFAYEYVYESDEVEIKLVGSGKNARDRISGEFEVRYNGTGILNVEVSDFDLANAKKGVFNGNFSITPNKMLIKLMGRANPDFSMDWLADLKVDVALESSKDGNKLKMGVWLDKDDLGSLTLVTRHGKGKTPSVPENGEFLEVTDEDDLQDYLEDLDWDAFLDNLRKCDMPTELLDQIEDALDDSFDDLEFYD